MIEDEEVEDRRRQVAALLGRDTVSISAPGQPHVTLWAAGFEPTVPLPDGGSIPIQVGAPDTFASAPYLRVTCPAAHKVRSRMTADGLTEDREESYVPHVTVGTYQRRVPMAQIHERLSRWSDPGPIPVTGRIRHLVVDTRSPDGALTQPPTAG